MPNHIILVYYYQYKYKMDFYQEGINYRSFSWKARIVYHKPTNKDEDRWMVGGVWWNCYYIPSYSQMVSAVGWV